MSRGDILLPPSSVVAGADAASRRSRSSFAWPFYSLPPPPPRCSPRCSRSRCSFHRYPRNRSHRSPRSPPLSSSLQQLSSCSMPDQRTRTSPPIESKDLGKNCCSCLVDEDVASSMPCRCCRMNCVWHSIAHTLDKIVCPPPAAFESFESFVTRSGAFCINYVARRGSSLAESIDASTTEASTLLSKS